MTRSQQWIRIQIELIWIRNTDYNTRYHFSNVPVQVGEQNILPDPDPSERNVPTGSPRFPSITYGQKVNLLPPAHDSICVGNGDVYHELPRVWRCVL